MIIVTSKKNVQRCFSKERKPRHVFCRIAASVVAGVYDRGMWRSPVAQRSGGPEVASSNLVIPTSTKKIRNQSVPVFFVSKAATKFT